VTAAEQQLQAREAALNGNFMNRASLAVRGQLGTGLWILAGILAIPPAFKACLYYVLAPLVCRMRPVRLIECGSSANVPRPDRSAVSLEFVITPGQEILVHPDYLQSSSKPARKVTQWFLNSRLPISSIASGMCALMRINPEADTGTKVVVSSQKDAFGEVCAIELPADAALVAHPRSLAGVIKQDSDPVIITSHWRLFSVHAWLTLQLRYLVFNGPCTLIMKGCRGVRTEEPDPEKPRMINQASTIGFSANLEYQNTRCETFVSYLFGKESLFNDLFSGGPGRFVYEEMPNAGKKGGISGRGIEGVFDAVFKVFGI